MIFATHWYFLFAAAFFPLYWLARWPAPRRAVLLVACLFFHWHFAGPAGVLPIAVLGVITYVAALTRQRLWCHLAIALCVAALIFYKYTLFLSGSVLAALHPALAQSTDHLVRSWLHGIPLGISFFVFEFVHYLIEVARGGAPLRRPDDFALFAVFFPSLVAGPIKRYRDFTTSLQIGLAEVSAEDVAVGGQRVALGFAKKLLIADNLTQVLTYFEPQFTSLSTGEAWLFLAALAARILFDFSGYSDLAIGFSRMAGIRLPENFNWPYLATSLQDFWQRWHISLSSWIRDYVYIPLGGNRLGPARRVGNGLVAFVLCGAWHGPAWHFVAWGLWHGVGLAVNATYRRIPGLGPALERTFLRMPPLSWAATMGFVAFGWLIFFYDVPRAWAMAVKLLSFR